MAGRAVVKSFAKINLLLDVICKRPDGYHNIETILQTVSLSDTLEIEPISSGIRINCDDPCVPTDERNLVSRAFIGFKKAAGFGGGVSVSIQKNIPPGSGLGGGSSNAAATLVALNRLLQGGLSDKRLRKIGREIGADVPFFISGGTAAAWQIGDRIKPLPAVAQSFIILAIPPRIRVSTGAAYAMIDAPECRDAMPESLSQCSDKLRAFARVLDPTLPLSSNAAVKSLLHNSLERPVLSRYAELAELKQLLLKSGAKGALMSGSGSAFFGLAESEKEAVKIKEMLERSGSFRCFVVHTVGCGSELHVPE